MDRDAIIQRDNFIREYYVFHKDSIEVYNKLMEALGVRQPMWNMAVTGE